MKALVLITLALGILVVSLTVEAQQPGKVSRIGVLYPGSPAAAERWQAILLQSLHDLGYVEGQTITFTYRYAEEKPERLPNLAAELVQLPVDVIVAGPPEAVQAAKQVTRCPFRKSCASMFWARQGVNSWAGSPHVALSLLYEGY